MNLEKIIKDTVHTDFQPLLLKHQNHLNAIQQALDGCEYSQICPQREKLFAAFQYFDVKDTKVVILGMDPYHTKGVANGLAFSVNSGQKVPPSLVNIFKEIDKELPELQIDKSDGNLERWAKQGVLLMNSAFTVQTGKAGSHMKLWKAYTDALISDISQQCPLLVFFLWGNFAKGKSNLIDNNKHFVLTSAHPSPLSASNFFGCGHFKRANEILEANKLDEIDWSSKSLL